MLTGLWPTKRIQVPLTDLTLVSAGRYSLTATRWWELLREMSGSAEGIAETYLIGSNFPYGNTPPTGSTPRIIDIINSYTVEFLGGPYTLDILDGNTNLGLAAIHPVGDSVAVNTNNVVGQSVLTTAQTAQLIDIYTRLGLNSNNAITDTTAGIDSANGDIDIDRTGDGTTTSTLTRQ